jgi:membrane fusion protein (multidrug efflux system)
MRYRLGGVALLAALALAGCGGGKKERPEVTPEAGFIVVKAESVPLMVELAGRTAAFETSDVRPQVSGIVKARLFTEGGIVRKGQALYQIDSSLYRAAVSQAQANLQAAEATREGASARADRFKPLAQIQAVSQQDYVDAVALSKQSAAAVAQNRAALETARINLSFTTVPAPISGRIGRSLVTTGALVTTNQVEPLTSIQRLDPIYVDIQQSSTDLLALRQQLAKGGVVPSSTTVRLKLEDGSDYGHTGTLEFSEVVVDPSSGAVTLRARFPNPQGLLLPGMFVRARLSQATNRNGILVPQTGVTHDQQGNPQVILVGPDDKPLTQRVEAVRTIGADWLVTSGLKPGDKVIVEGLGRIRPGKPIKPVPAGSKPRPMRGGPGGGAGGPPGGNG